MAKQTIRWHKKGRDSWIKTLEQEKRWIETQQASYNESEARLKFYSNQIWEAEFKGLKEFDREKFSIKCIRAIIEKVE